MFASRPAVHPVEAPPLADEAENPLGVRMKDVQGMPGTPGGLALRLVQFAFAVAALGVMTSTSDFPAVTAFCHLVAAAILQSLWSISLAVLDLYALLVRRCLRNRRALCWFAIGDGITATLTFASACASAGITVRDEKIWLLITVYLGVALEVLFLFLLLMVDFRLLSFVYYDDAGVRCARISDKRYINFEFSHA
ncbi:hypothetical protein OPV22_028648 [Ensete ventricosum]|uniref:CASP-like protein n=1 Tax=Ensete ventricosum TaxID=4639 RepID=A0AAV8P5A0_ENSVE|nr:hypothetical protein OPV22_028648 [Ensete ventricosum]